MYNPITVRPHPSGLEGTQKLYRFDNGFGASVVKTRYTYGGDLGLWELAVISFYGENEDDFNLTYETPITDDVVGYLSLEEVDKLLVQIAALENPNAP